MRRIIKGFAVLATGCVLGAGLVLVSLWIERNTALTLPTPTGPFAVGRVIYDWKDNTAVDPLAPIAGTKRELLVWIWYPTEPGQSAGFEDYVPGQMRAEAGPKGGPLRLVTRKLSKVHAHSIGNTALSSQQKSYPVVVMRTGASLEAWNYTTLAEDLASHGYIVVGFDAPYRTFAVVFPDGRMMRRTPENNPDHCWEKTGEEQERCANRILAAWTSDASFVLDRLGQLNASDETGKFTGKVDLTHVGIFGHSFGGAAAAMFCHEDSRCKAGVDVDGAPHGSVIQTGIDRPFLFLLGDHSREPEAEVRQIRADIQSIYDHLPANRRGLLEIRGANHFQFSDDGALLKSHIVMNTLRLFGIVRMERCRQLELTAYCLRSFFDAHLKNAGSSSFETFSPLYPEIQILK
jgi:predicted dienelactone hydrolase